MTPLSVRLTKALEFDAASLSSVTNRDPRGRSSEYKTAYFEGGKFYHARLQPFLEALIEIVNAASSSVIVTDFYLKRSTGTVSETKMELVDWHSRLDKVLTKLSTILDLDAKEG